MDLTVAWVPTGANGCLRLRTWAWWLERGSDGIFYDLAEARVLKERGEYDEADRRAVCEYVIWLRAVAEHGRQMLKWYPRQKRVMSDDVL